MTRAEVVAEAQRWLGVPYRHKGRSRAGLDCIGLLVVVGQRFGVPHTDRPDYENYPDAERRILAELDTVLEMGAGAWPGTVGVFADHRLPCHCGIFTARHGVVHLTHAMLARRVVLEEPYEAGSRARPWRLVRRYQFPGLEA